MPKMKTRVDRNKVIEAAAKQANEKGLANLNLREIAQEFDVSTPSLYNHIQSLDELKHAVMLYAIPLLTRDVTYAIVGHTGMAALKAMGLAYYRFAVDNPGLYEALQWWNRSSDPEVGRAFDDFIRIIGKILEPYELDEKELQHVLCYMRGIAHGFSSIAVFGGFGSDMPLEENYEWAVDVALRGLELELDRNREVAAADV